MVLRRTLGYLLLACVLMAGVSTPLKAVEDSVLFARDGSLLVTAQGKDVHLWDWKKKERVKTLSGSGGPVLALAFSPDGAFLATGSDVVTIWKFPEGTVVRTIKGHTQAITGLAFSPDGRSLASSSYDATVRVWDWNKGRLLRLLKHRFGVLAVAWSPDSLYLATAENPHDADATGCNNAINLWEGSSNNRIWQIPGQRYWVNHIAFAPGGKAIAGAGYESRVFIYDMPKGNTLSRLSCQFEALRAIAFSGDGRLIAMGGDSHKVCLWKRDHEDYRDWTPLWHADVGQVAGSIDFSPDDAIIAVGPGAQLLDAKTGTVLATLK
jgi:WD40 repeat protein